METSERSSANHIAPRHNHPSSCDFVDSPQHRLNHNRNHPHNSIKTSQNAEDEVDKQSKFWNRKGVIKMDPNNNDRCSHTIIPPSAMMTLAMELQVSNRGKASKIFKKAKSNARVASPENAPIENEKSMLPELWVVPESGAKSESEGPATASHLKPALDKSDFVFRPGFDSRAVQEHPEKDEECKDGLNQDELKFLESINIADLVGSKDNVIVYPDSDDDDRESKPRTKNRDRAKQKSGSDVTLCVDLPGASESGNEQARREAEDDGSRKCSGSTTTNRPTSVNYEFKPGELAPTGDGPIKFSGSERNADARGVIAAAEQRNNVSIRDREGDRVEQCRLDAAPVGANKSFVAASLVATKARAKDDSREKQLRSCDALPSLADGAEDNHRLDTTQESFTEGQRSGAVSSQPVFGRDRAQSLSHQRDLQVEEKRSATPEYFRALSQNDTASASTLSSSSLSSSLFSLSSLGSVSSTSLYFSSVNGASEKTSVASCASITPDSVDAHERRKHTPRGREIYAKPKHNYQAAPQPAVASLNGSNHLALEPSHRQENRSNAMQSTVKYNSLSCSGGPVRNADDEVRIPRRSPLLQANAAPYEQQPPLVTSRSSSRVRVRSCDGSVSPSRKVICEFVGQEAPALPDQQAEIKGRVVSKAVFPDESDPSLVSPVLRLQRENAGCAKCKGKGYTADADKMIACCCCGPKPKAPPRGDSKGATEKFKGGRGTPSPVPAARSRTPSQTTVNSQAEVGEGQAVEIKSEAVEAAEVQPVSRSPKPPAAKPRNIASPAKAKLQPTQSPGLQSEDSSNTGAGKFDAKPDTSTTGPRIEGCRITLASPNNDPSSQRRVVVKNTLTSGHRETRVDGGKAGTESIGYRNDVSLGAANVEHPRVNIIGGSKITLLKADSDMNCAQATSPRSRNKAQFGTRVQQDSGKLVPDTSIKQGRDKVGVASGNTAVVTEEESVVVAVSCETQAAHSIDDKAPATRGPADKNDSRPVMQDTEQREAIEPTPSPRGVRKPEVQKPVTLDRSPSVSEQTDGRTSSAESKAKSQRREQSPGQVEAIVAEPKIVRFHESKARIVKSPEPGATRNRERIVGSSTVESVFSAPQATEAKENPNRRRMVKRSQSLGSAETETSKPVYCNTVTLTLRSPKGKSQGGSVRYVSPTPPLTHNGDSGTSKASGASTQRQASFSGRADAKQDYKKWQGQSHNFQEASVSPTVISCHRQIQEHGREQHRGHALHKVTFNPQVSVRAYGGGGGEKAGSESGFREGSRVENETSGRRKVAAGMVGNEEVKQEKMMAPPHSATDDEDFSGVVEPPPIKVKDIRAMFKRGPDYQDYAKPRSLSSSNVPARKDRNRAASHGSQSDAEVCDEISPPDTQVAKQVMHLFKGALEIENELDVFEEDTLRKQQELTNAANGTPAHQRNGQIVTDINTNYVVTKAPPQTLPKPSKTASPSRLAAPTNDEPPASPSDIKSSIAQIKSESEEVASFDESLDKFYDVLNDLTS